MNNRISIKMPIPCKVWAFYYNKNKEVGFAFDQQSMFNFRNNVGFADDADGDTLKAWVSVHGNDRFYLESLYGAHESYCIHNVIKPINKDKFTLAIHNSDKDLLKKVIEMWNESLKFGLTQMPGAKKKAKAKR